MRMSFSSKPIFEPEKHNQGPKKCIKRPEQQKEKSTFFLELRKN
jgi:hypothetical protein